MGRDRRDSGDSERERIAPDGLPPTQPVTRTIAAAIVLFTIGSFMLFFGVRALGTDYDRAIAMLVIGGITFLPGLYACTIIVGTLLRWPGYDVRDLPSYDND